MTSDAVPRGGPFALGEHTVPKLRYTSPDFLALEMERVFARAWHLAGPASDVERVGACFTFELGDDSILVVRDEGGVRAFHNVCRHRGRLLRDPGLAPGVVRSLRCPYHHWEYALDGRLCHAPAAESFAGCVAGSGAASLALVPVAAEVWEGFVWVCLDARPEPLAGFLGPLAARLAAYRLGDYALVEDRTLEVACNWKVSVDAFNEAYHLPAVHPELLAIADATRARAELVGRHSVLHVPFGAPGAGAAEPEAIGEALGHLMREAGVDPATFRGAARDVRAAMQRALRARADLDLGALDDAQLTDNLQFHVFPGLTLNVYGMRLMLLRHRPHPSDPGRMLLDQQQYVRVPRGTRRPPRPRPERFRSGEGSLGHVTDQDVRNLVRVQRGMRSRGCEALVLGALESRILHMHRVLDAYLADEPISY
jgi:phenylpropionate dioxygenase-like ring-hydroxylating dioxygenase large terminal subunit